jgi:hypothetical protein
LKEDTPDFVNPKIVRSLLPTTVGSLRRGYPENCDIKKKVCLAHEGSRCQAEEEKTLSHGASAAEGGSLRYRGG